MRTFGIEIEMVGIDRATIAKAISSALGGEEPEHVVDQEDETMSWERVRTQNGDIWKVEDDDSLNAPEELRAEIVSPVLKESSIGLLKAVVSEIAATGARTNESCGVHVHIGAEEATVEDVCRLINVMIEQEPELIKEFGCNAKRLAEFARPMTTSFVENFRRNPPTNGKELERLWYGEPVDPKWQDDRYHESRYRGLNLQSYFYRFTVEFRYFDASLDPDRIEAYIRRCIEIANMAGMP